MQQEVIRAEEGEVGPRSQPALQRTRAGRPKGSVARVESDEASLGLHLFALARAWLQGLDAAQAWQRYMQPVDAGSMPRDVFGSVAAVVEKIARASSSQVHAASLSAFLSAARAQRAEQLRLQRSQRLSRERAIAAGMQAEPPPPTGADVAYDSQAREGIPPTLEDFAAALGMEAEFYTEAELLELYAEAHGEQQAVAPRETDGSDHVEPGQVPVAQNALQVLADLDETLAADRRVDRGRSPRQELDGRHTRPREVPQPLRGAAVEAINALQASVAVHPQPDDAVGRWLAPDVARRLNVAGFATLADLAALAARRGQSWHKSVPGLGITRSARISKWLGGLDLGGGYKAGVGAVAATHAVRPLEQMRFEPRLRGGPGQRGPLARTRVGPDQDPDDLEAYAEWMQGLRQVSAATARAYAAQTEKFVLWALLVADKPISGIDSDDAQSFAAFVRSPPSHWVMQRRVPRSDPAWRPYAASAGRAVEQQALSAVRAMYSGLMASGHLRASPFASPRAGIAARASDAGAGLADLPASTNAQRQKADSGGTTRRDRLASAGADRAGGPLRLSTRASEVCALVLKDMRIDAQAGDHSGTARARRQASIDRLDAILGLVADAGLGFGEIARARMSDLRVVSDPGAGHAQRHVVFVRGQGRGARRRGAGQMEQAAEAGQGVRSVELSQEVRARLAAHHASARRLAAHSGQEQASTRPAQDTGLVMQLAQPPARRARVAPPRDPGGIEDFDVGQALGGSGLYRTVKAFLLRCAKSPHADEQLATELRQASGAWLRAGAKRP